MHLLRGQGALAQNVAHAGEAVVRRHEHALHDAALAAQKVSERRKVSERPSACIFFCARVMSPPGGSGPTTSRIRTGCCGAMSRAKRGHRCVLRARIPAQARPWTRRRCNSRAGQHHKRNNKQHTHPDAGCIVCSADRKRDDRGRLCTAAMSCDSTVSKSSSASVRQCCNCCDVAPSPASANASLMARAPRAAKTRVQDALPKI